MSVRLPHILFLLSLLATLAACAIVGRPTGGDLDRDPPVLDSIASSAIYQINARPTELSLVFDEYVQLKNATRDIILTPTPEAGRARYTQRGREVRVDLSDVEYRDSTTYQLQFGEAVQDFNEGNPALGLRYIWSTGPALDSLSVGGRALNNLDGQPAIASLVGLWRSPSDTALTETAPDYFARVDSQGRFELDYLAPGRYQLAAYTDANANYRLEVGAEPLAFLDSLIRVAPLPPGVLSPDYRLVLSAERPPLIALRTAQYFPGLVRMTLNQPVPPEAIVSGLPGPQLATYRSADTLYVAYDASVDSLAADTLSTVVVSLEGESDTARLRKTDLPAAPRVRLAKELASTLAGETTVSLAFNLPLAGFDASRIAVLLDSTPYPKGAFTLDTTNVRLLRWQAPTDTVPVLRVRLLPGAVTTVFGASNIDTLEARARSQRATEFGEVDLSLGQLDTSTAYVLELLNSAGVVERTIQLSPKQNRVRLPRVAGGEYSIRLVEDANRDGRYSPGDRRLRRQPERVTAFPLQKVQPDWLVEEKFEVLWDDNVLVPAAKKLVE